MVSSFFPRVMHHPLCRTLKIAGIEMLVSFFFAQRHKLPCLIHQGLILLLGTHSGRPPEAFGGLRLPTGVMKLVDQSLQSIETWHVVLSFLQMSPKPAVTFFQCTLCRTVKMTHLLRTENLGVAFYLAK